MKMPQGWDFYMLGQRADCMYDQLTYLTDQQSLSSDNFTKNCEMKNGYVHHTP